jgi:hypothetical protein
MRIVYRADPSGLELTLSCLNTGRDPSALMAFMLGSAEYTTRLGITDRRRYVLT